MSYECSCGWTYIGDDGQEELLARIEHLQTEHGMKADTDEFNESNTELIRIVHQALRLIDTDDLDGWYTSQIERMRSDAEEIVDWEGID